MLTYLERTTAAAVALRRSFEPTVQALAAAAASATGHAPTPILASPVPLIASAGTRSANSSASSVGALFSPLLIPQQRSSSSGAFTSRLATTSTASPSSTGGMVVTSGAPSSTPSRALSSLQSSASSGGGGCGGSAAAGPSSPSGGLAGLGLSLANSMAARIKLHHATPPPKQIRLRSRPPQPTREQVILGQAKRAERV